MLGVSSSAWAQVVDRRTYAAATDGVALPSTPLAGDHDARSVSANPAGLTFLPGWDRAVVLTFHDADNAPRAGTGGGGFIAAPAGGGWLPRFGWGAGLEHVRSPRSGLLPDPGSPWRFTIAGSVDLWRGLSAGISWHRFADDGPLDGVSSFDVGLSRRFGNYFATGAVVRNLNRPRVAGELVDRHFAGDVLLRPLGTRRLELTAGGHVDSATIYGVSGIASLAISAGVRVHGNVDWRTVAVQQTVGIQSRDVTEREVRVTAGVEFSFGAIGLTSHAAMQRTTQGNSFLGGTLVGRWSDVAAPSVLGPPDRIERVEISGTLSGRSYAKLIERLVAMETDRAVRALVVVFDAPSGGWASCEELRERLLALRRAGKKVFAYLVSGGTRDYFVASAADKIYFDPAGALRLLGISGSILYFRGAFDLLGISPEFEKIAEYKSAPEQYTNTGGSEAATTMREELFGSINQHVIAAIAEGRHISVAAVQALIDKGPYSAGDLAKEPRLVDAVALPEKISELVAAEVGGGIGLGAAQAETADLWQAPQIAVIHIEGDIIDGESQSLPLLGRKMAGGDTIRAAIAAARFDDRIKAIVLRIDSPGGSALASELISREVFATRGVKPIICSMGDLAASGGYFVAAGCDRIFSSPTTITGSIGIFFGKFEISGLLAKLGISVESVHFGERSEMDSWFRPFTPDERVVLLDKLRDMYGRFVGAVSEGRKMDKTKVDDVGRGHVWTGLQAKERGLVDEFGGLAAAMAMARSTSGLSVSERVQWVHLPVATGGVLRSLLGLGTIGVNEQSSLTRLFELVPASLLVAPNTAQTRLPFDLIGN